MTDERRKIFVGIFLENGSKEDPDEIFREITEKLAADGRELHVNLHKPPKIFTEEDLQRRFIDHWEMADRFIEDYLKRFGVALQLDQRLLYLTVISAYDDIERYKLYHLEKPYNDRSDAVKRAAYLTKWISRVSPLYCPSSVTSEDVSDADKTKEIVDTRPALANLLFALFVSSAHIMQRTASRFSWGEQLAYQLSYDLLFRQMNEDALLAIFQMVADMADGNKVINVL